MTRIAFMELGYIWPRDMEALDSLSAEPTTESWKAIEAILAGNYHNPDIEAAKILLAAVAAHRLVAFPPAWELLIAPSGSMKTDLLETLRDLPKVHFIDEVTAKTFISGKVDDPGSKRKGPASLLHRIGEDGIVVAADLSTITALDKHSLPAILSQLRRIYDGNYRREFGTDDNLDERTWTGRLTLLAGATESVDRQYEVFNSLGERFVRVRLPRPSGVDAGLAALRHTASLAPELRAAVQSLLFPILSAPTSTIVVPSLPTSIEVRLANLTELITRGRASVHRASYNHAILGDAQIEGNTRLPQQLAQIGRGWALLCGRQDVNDEDFRLIRRAAFDCLPPQRRAVLLALIGDRNPYAGGSSSGLISRVIEDLELTGLVVKVKIGAGGRATAKLSDLAVCLMSVADGLSPNIPCNGEEKEWGSPTHPVSGEDEWLPDDLSSEEGPFDDGSRSSAGEEAEGQSEIEPGELARLRRLGRL